MLESIQLAEEALWWCPYHPAILERLLLSMRGVWIHGSLGDFWTEGISEMVMLFLLRFELYMSRIENKRELATGGF